MNTVTLHTGGEFVEIHLADFVEGVAEVVGSFSGEAEGGVYDGAGGGVDGGAAGTFLIFVYRHD